MFKLNLFILFLIVFLSTFFFINSGGGAYSLENKIIAVINNEIITKSDLDTSKVFQEKSLSFLIEKKLQLQTAHKKGILTSDSEILSAIEDIKKVNTFKSDKEFEDALIKDGISIEKYKRDLKDQLTIIKLINKEIKSKITINDKEIETYYLTNKTIFLLPEEIKIAYINITINFSDSTETIQKSQNKINDILTDLNNNKSFNEIIKLYRENSEININEDSGYLKKGHLLKELDKAAFELKEGEISGVISTPSGFYILKVIDKKKTEYKQLEEVRNEIKNILFQNKTEKMYKEWLYNLKKSSYIDII